ncbi:hypothetical protein GCK32_012387 [Trichostrongylus colubriformis]|uniref:Uncharacterized protein n=1 Tax=Trichostrongylus colubriformis TaxID=6319 RepID=A0AAN8IEA9_TRICO
MDPRAQLSPQNPRQQPFNHIHLLPTSTSFTYRFFSFSLLSRRTAENRRRNGIRTPRGHQEDGSTQLPAQDDRPARPRARTPSSP